MNRLLEPVRLTVQLMYLTLSLWIGLQFYRFVEFCRSGGATPFVPRPASVEGFLPISGLLGLRDWIESGAINPVHPAAVVIFVTAIALSFLLRRAFCSWICPVGTLSELFWKGGFRMMKRNFRLHRYADIPLRGVKYLLLLFFLWSIVFGMPAFAVTAFIHSDYHKVADVRMLGFFLDMSTTAAVILGAIAFFSVFLRSPFCRYLCPYGALLGLCAAPSPARVTRDEEKCVSCGACSAACSAYLDVMHSKRVVSPECIGCLRCVGACRVPEAIGMRIFGLPVQGLVVALLAVLLFCGGTVLGKATGNWNGNVSVQEYMHLLLR